MCGISGLLNINGEHADPNVLKRMIGTLRHRGPDGLDVRARGNVGLAHARLSIIDAAGGRQPMSTPDKSLSVTFNGEIFNYIELREELIARGRRFATRSDTEVILHAYAEFGEDCVRRFNGQWAFALWDARRQKLFLSRDRLGVRPLFHTTAGSVFLFGSEIKSLFAHPGVLREIDPVALDQIFTFWVTLAPRTFFKKILELPPGHSLRVEKGRATVWPYWKLSYAATQASLPADDREKEEKLRGLLVDATRLRLRSDVPVGAYLSGGLDSTVTAALIRKYTDAPLKTFSIGFDDPEYDESAYQEEAVRSLGSEHQRVRCTTDDISQVFPDVIWHTEKPILRAAPAPLYLLAQLVRKNNFKVVITGEGADEILGGYDIFKEAKIRRFCALRPESRFRPLLLKRLYPFLPGFQKQSPATLKAFFHVKPDGMDDPLFSHMPRWELTSQLKIFFSDAVKDEVKTYDGYAEIRESLPPEFHGWERLSRAQFMEAGHLLPGYILSSQGDRMAMAHSVEGRFPFLDHRVVEFASVLPARLKIKVLNEKYILKRCAGDLVPESIRRRPKQSYRAPDGKSFFAAKPRDYVEELLAPERIRRDGLFNSAAVEKLVEKFRRGNAIGTKDNMALVGILSTQIAADLFIHRYNERIPHEKN